MQQDDMQQIEVEALIRKMAADIQATFSPLSAKDYLMIGIHTGGVWIPIIK